MVFEQIEKLKREYTDKYVLVDPSRPELRRFAHMTGQVKTVNMSGRALVEFDGDNNIGWYDIDLAFLTETDAPSEEAAAPAKPAKAVKPAPATKPAPAAKSTKPAAAGGGGGGMSVADIMAAARTGSAPTAASQATAPAKSAPAKSAPAKPAPAKPAPAKPAAMSVDDILAAARGDAAPAPAAEPTESPAAPEQAAVSEPPAPAASSSIPETPPADPPAGELPTETDAIVDWCRERDG